ncbi:tetratricopeptide repeat protein [bacterium]|nr:tetratricopeptide repeat protein [bacterium]
MIEVAARLHEENGTLDAAERLLSLLSDGHCAGGVNLPLAEFRLRHRRQVEKALDAFRSAAAHDPENPHWGLRIAQSYFLLGRKREGQELLDAVVHAAGDKPLIREGAEMVRTWQSSC